MNIEKFTAEVKTFERNKKIKSGYIALSDLKTLDKFVADAKKLQNENTKISTAYDKAWGDRSNLQKEIKPTEKRMSDTNKNVNKVKTDNQKRLNDAQKAADNAQRAYAELSTKYNKAFETEMSAEQALKNQQGKVDAFQNRFKSAIEGFKNAAKALGIKVDIKKYTTALSNVNNL